MRQRDLLQWGLRLPSNLPGDSFQPWPRGLVLNRHGCPSELSRQNSTVGHLELPESVGQRYREQGLEQRRDTKNAETLEQGPKSRGGSILKPPHQSLEWAPGQSCRAHRSCGLYPSGSEGFANPPLRTCLDLPMMGTTKLPWTSDLQPVGNGPSQESQASSEEESRIQSHYHNYAQWLEFNKKNND